MAEDLPGTTRPGDQLKSHMNQEIKQHTVRDAEGRPILVFIAPINAKEGTPCTCTELVYYGPGNNQVMFMQEREYRWKANWDNGTFDPSVSYDPDGDGDL